MLLSPRAGLSTSRTTVHALAWHALRPLRPARTFPLSPSNVDPFPPHPKAISTSFLSLLPLRRTLSALPLRSVFALRSC